LPAQGWVFELLDGCEERVEVEMGEYRHPVNATVPPWSPLRHHLL
jgi:hypothetical protein